MESGSCKTQCVSKCQLSEMQNKCLTEGPINYQSIPWPALPTLLSTCGLSELNQHHAVTMAPPRTFHPAPQLKAFPLGTILPLLFPQPIYLSHFGYTNLLVSWPQSPVLFGGFLSCSSSCLSSYNPVQSPGHLQPGLFPLPPSKLISIIKISILQGQSCPPFISCFHSCSTFT